MQDKFKLKKIKRNRKILQVIEKFLFFCFQIGNSHREKRSDYGITLFEYFHKPWLSDEFFLDSVKKVENYTLNPISRLYQVWIHSKQFIREDTAFVEIGSWKGGVSALVSLNLTNSNIKNVDIYCFDTFDGVVMASDKDSFFSGSEYSDATVEDVESVFKLTDSNPTIITGTFPESAEKTGFDKKISFVHIDVDTYESAKRSIMYIKKYLSDNSAILLDDYGGWFTDGITLLGSELLEEENTIFVPLNTGQGLILFK